MLPGRRTYTDEDVVSVLGDALSVYRRIIADDDVPAELYVSVFGHCVNMVGNRTLEGIAGLPAMEIPGRRH